MKKKIIFFDGDGTLWYPKLTKRTMKTHWIYHDEKIKDNYLEHLVLTPGTKETLVQLHERGIILVVISANPYDQETALKEITERLHYFGLIDLFYSYRSSSDGDPNDKGTVMLDIISELGFKKEDALMIGDSYFYDYKAAQDVGIDAFFIENTISKMPDVLPADLQTINEIRDLVKLVN